MTTVASGRCTSAPAEVESAIGMKPRHATSAVIEHRAAAGRAPPGARVLGREALAAQLEDVGHEHDAVQDGDAEERDEADAGRDREGHPAQRQREDRRRVTASGTFR